MRINNLINTLFDKIYVLTIERNIDRHAMVEQYLSNLDFEYWYGIDVGVRFSQFQHVSEMPKDFFKEHNVDQEYVTRSTRGQLGAYLSIKKMIDSIAANNEQAIIFEDDFIPIKSDWQQTFKEALKEVPQDWDILLLGYYYQGFIYRLSYYRSLRWIPILYNAIKRYLGKSYIKVLPRKHSKYLDKSGRCYGGHAFCLSQKGAAYLSKNLDPMRESGDVLVSRMIENHELKAYSVYPCLFLQNEKFPSKTKLV